jgi:hypothetical protein
MPILILQGERDYQVTMVDFGGWERALKGRGGAELKHYPRLNHLFVAGDGPLGPGEYERAGHVDENVISDIADFVNRARAKAR